MIGQVRTARPEIVLDGRDFYGQLAPYFKHMTYTDNCDGKKADDFELELADRDGKFISEWMPKKGAFLDASIIAERWFAPNSAALKLDCGRFWIDSIEFVVPQRTVSVKGTSLPTGVRIKQSIESRGWENAKLKDIASQIAGESQMELVYPSDIVNPRYGRTEMHDESPLTFLMKRAKDAKLAIKIHRNQLVFFDEQKLEEAASQFSLVVPNLAGGLLGPLLGGFGIDFGSGAGRTYQVASAHFNTKVNDTTKKAKVSHTDPETGDTEQGEHTAEDEDVEEGDVEDETSDQVNDDPDSFEIEPGELDQSPEFRAEEGSDYSYNADAASSLKAKSHVREKNKSKNTATIQLAIGNPLIAAGQTFDLKGVGQFDGKWFIESVHHEVAPEFNTELHVRRCLKGY